MNTRLFYALIVVVLAAVFILFFLEPKQDTQIQPSYEEKHELKDIAVVSHGGEEKYLWLAVFSNSTNKSIENSQKSLKLFFYDRAPLTTIYLIEGRWAGATKYLEFKKSLALLKDYGFDLKTISLDDFKTKKEDAIYILPSGVWPVGLEKPLQAYLTENSILIYLGTNENILINDNSGTILKGPINPSILNLSKKEGTDISFFSSEGIPRILNIPTSVDQIKDFKSFSLSLLDLILTNQPGSLRFLEEKFLSTNYANLLAVNGSEKYTFILLYSPYNSKLPSAYWLKELRSYPGIIMIQKNIESGIAPMQAILNVQENQKLNFYIRLLDEAYNQKDIIKFGQYNGSGNVWVGSIAELTLPNSKFSVIEIIDQYHRIYAKTAVYSTQYSIQLVSKRANSRTYCIKKNDKDFTEPYIFVKKANGTWTKIEVANSCFSVSANWNPSGDKLYFKIGSKEFEDSWTSDSSKWSLFTYLGLPILLLFLVWHFFFRKEKSNLLYLEVPEYFYLGYNEVKINKEWLLKNIHSVMSFEQIRKLIFDKIKEEYDLAATTESIENLLLDLVKNGQLIKKADYYAPASFKEEEVEKEVIFNSIKDFLTKRGILISKNLIDSKSRVWRIVQSLEDLFKKPIPDFAVFLDEKKKNEILDQLHSNLDKNSARVLIAILSSKLKLKTVQDLAKETESM